MLKVLANKSQDRAGGTEVFAKWTCEALERSSYHIGL